MLKVGNIEVMGFEPAIRGMRNPMNSWNKSSSCWFDMETYTGEGFYDGMGNVFHVDDNDLKLMKSLFKGGIEHRKYARMIQVYLDITAPLYWWKEFDTYKVGTVANSCSTMHKIASKEFTLDDFSHEHMKSLTMVRLSEIIEMLNYYRERFNTFKNKDDWWQMIQLLPSSYNQKRTIMMNYETVFNIIRQRENHKLDEWHTLVDELKKLPYVQEIMGE